MHEHARKMCSPSRIIAAMAPGTEMRSMLIM